MNSRNPPLRAARLDRLYFALPLILLLHSGPRLEAHDDTETHARLTVASFLFLDQVFPGDGLSFTDDFRRDVRQGSIDEDATPKFENHFYNPKTGGKFSDNVQSAPERAAHFWFQSRANFRAGARFAAGDNLGAVMHLLQDMTSPAHVHLDDHGKIFLGHCEGDGDDFEMWGYCDDIGINAILQYVRYNNIQDSAILSPLATGLRTIFGNQLQRVSHTRGDNIAYSFVHELADKVYDFTTFGIVLHDAWGDDSGGGELKLMFPTLQETRVPNAWWIENIGYSQGQCSGPASSFPQAWWMMSCSREGYCGTPRFPRSIYCVEGMAYIENTGGGGGAGRPIPENLIPDEYNRPWFIARYNNSKYNTARTSMLRIYGDVLYSAAVAYGAGLLQTYLDEAIMPRPVTQDATVLDGGKVRLNGAVNPGGVSAVAWFEWGTNSSFGNPTVRRVISSNTTFSSVSDPITGLLPETTHYYRLVSSNQYGIRYGIARTFRTLNFTVAGGLNAWQITDDDAQSGSTLYYVTNLTAPQHQAATNGGWRFTINSRLTTDFGGSQTMAFGYNTGSRRFLVWLDLATNGNLIADFDGVTTVPLTTVGATLYHTHEILYTNGTATYLFDGVPQLQSWQGTTSTQAIGQVFWGARSQGGKGQMNFNVARFESLGAVARYGAGSAGNPPEPLDPIAMGWTRIPGTVPLSEHSIAPDGEPFVPAVETLSATDMALSSAQLNGQVNPHGNATAAWFEWGSTTSYGNKTPIRAVGTGQTETNLSAQIGGLESSTLYHCRLVASNGFGIRFGNNQTFQTPSFLVTGNVPNAWQITDNSAAAGLSYITNLTVSQQQAAINNGWRLTVNSRLLTNFGSHTMVFLFSHGPTRFAVWWDLDEDGDLRALVENWRAFKLTTNRLGAALYHTHELRYYPSNRMAEYWFDGGLRDRWPGSSVATEPAGRIYWGAGGLGMGQMNFHRVQFDISGVGTVAAYNAGTSPNPAPSPVTQGWTLHLGPDGATAQGISPDLEAFLPTAEAETLAATAVGSTSAQLNGRVNAHGRQTAAWFEWGTRTSYGNRTPVQNAGAGLGAIDISSVLAGLEVDTTYHFRIVASNSFVTAFGHDQTLRTIWFADAAVNLPSMSAGSTAWGDYDHDGDLDLLLTGQTDAGDVSRIYRNDGGGSFSQVSAALIGVYQSSAVWGDYDRDGDLDILLSGRSSIGPVSRVYRNDRTNFTAINAGLPGLFMSSVAWADYDNDGDLDILLTGADIATNRLARIYRNDSSGGALGANFVNINASFAGTAEGAVTSGDFDGDNDHDFIITGLDSSGTPSTHYYRNDGAGVFTRLDLNLPGVHAGSIAAADYDNDGNLDLLLSGLTADGELTRLFRNIRNGPAVEFEEVQTGFANVSSSSVSWGDFDNDGDSDIALTGWIGGPFSAIYRNDGLGIFVPLTQELAGLFAGSTAWGDLDNDGDLDLLLAGRNDDASALRHALHVYWNLSPVANTVPTTPAGLAGSGVGDSATVTWKPAADDQTLLSALTYNLVLSSVTNGINLASPMADTTNGYRRVAQFGGAGHNHSWKFTGLNPGTYYFSVQAIDSAYAGGPFASWQSFEVAVPPVVIATSEILQPGRTRIVFVGAANTAYEVWGSTDLQIWTRLGPGVALSPGEFEYIDTTAPLTHRFYQIRTSGP